MWNKAKKLLSLLLALVMVCSLAAVPVYAAGEEVLPIVVLDSSCKTQNKYIYANSEYNSLDTMPELADEITGTFGGKQVELIPDWVKPSELYNGFKGSTDRSYDANTFTAATFTVKGTNTRVQAVSGTEVTLNIRVVGVNTMPACEGYTDEEDVNKSDRKKTVTKSKALAVRNEVDLAKLLDLPKEAIAGYKPVQFSDHQDWNNKAEDFEPFYQDFDTYSIVGWELSTYQDDEGNPLKLTSETLRNLAGEVNTTEKVVTLVPQWKCIPKWATVSWSKSSFKLTITPDSKADVTVIPPENITYGQTLGEPSATATLDSTPVQDAVFNFTYEGVGGTDYSENIIPPTDAGRYKVTATLATLGYSGSATAEFTISKAASENAEAYICVPNDERKTIEIDETFIPSNMARGAKIKVAPTLAADGKLIESCTANVNATTFTLKSKKDASSGSSQMFSLVLTSDNYETVTVNVTVYNDNVVVTGAKLKNDKTEFPSGTLLDDIIDLSGCNANVNGWFSSGTSELMDPYMKLMGPNDYTGWSVPVWFTTIGGRKYQVTVSVPDFTIMENMEAVVTITPPDDITYGETLGTPLATATVDGIPVPNATFDFAYEGISGTEYSENTIPPTDAGTYQVKATLTSDGYSGSAIDTFTIMQAESETTEAYICVPNGEMTQFKINEWFIPSNMARGAKIKDIPSIDTGNGNLIRSYIANVDATEFTLESKNGAPANSSQEFKLILKSDNYKTVTVTVIVYNDNVVITDAKLKDGKIEFPSGTPWKDIVDLIDCTATVNGEKTEGEFELMAPDTVTGPNKYINWPVVVLFTTDTDTKYQVTVYLPNFTVLEPEGGIDNRYKEDEIIYLILYANSIYNTDLDRLKDFVHKNKSTHVDTDEYSATWESDNKLSFNLKGLQPRGSTIDYWYSYTATLNGSNIKPRAYVTVIPVIASLNPVGNNSKVLKAADVTAFANDAAMMKALSLPETVNVSYEPAATPQNVTEDFKSESGTWQIFGWQMDGKALTLDALKAKANAAASRDVEVTLTPVFADADVPGWATIASTPAFKLTITPKTPVGVSWDGPKNITYGEALNLGTPMQQDNGGGIDSSGTWDFVYYNADGTRLPGQPTNAGRYKVQAVLNSATHSGASALIEFKIDPKNLDSITVTMVNEDPLVYNKQPQTPEYIVKDGEKTLIKGTDYTVAYTNNINAGTAAVTFTGIGNYAGKIEKNFTIEKLPLDADQKPVISGTAAAGHVLSASLPGVDAAELEWC